MVTAQWTLRCHPVANWPAAAQHLTPTNLPYPSRRGFPLGKLWWGQVEPQILAELDIVTEIMVLGVRKRWQLGLVPPATWTVTGSADHQNYQRALWSSRLLDPSPASWPDVEWDLGIHSSNKCPGDVDAVGLWKLLLPNMYFPCRLYISIPQELLIADALGQLHERLLMGDPGRTSVSTPLGFCCAADIDSHCSMEYCLHFRYPHIVSTNLHHSQSLRPHLPFWFCFIFFPPFHGA